MRRRAAAAALLVTALAGCGTDSSAQTGSTTTITVLAAASLTETFRQIAADLEDDVPRLRVVLSLGASSALAQQAVDGAPADVLATASPATMATAVDAGAAEEPRVFAGNTLQIAVPADDSGTVTGLADFADPDLVLALCAPEVPCGAAATEVLEAAGVVPRPDTLEQDVRAVLSKVRLGEVDAALVYRTDVRAAGADVRGIEVPEASSAVNDYLIARLSESRNPDEAALFVERVLAQEGQRVLADAGFDLP